MFRGPEREQTLVLRSQCQRVQNDIKTPLQHIHCQNSEENERKFGDDLVTDTRGVFYNLRVSCVKISDPNTLVLLLRQMTDRL